MTKQEEPGLYGVMAEFEEPSAVVAAARRTYAEGYRRINAYSPYPVEELSEAIGFRKNSVALVVFICGLLGCIGGFAMQIGMNGIDYPINVGGRPLLSWPAMIPVAFECTVLLAAFGAFIGNIVMNGLPQPYHPVFNVKRFSTAASVDRFFLCVEASDPKFNPDETRAFLATLGAKEVTDVEE
jgi:Alternative complex III, ActD subunit